jgi:uncharacterized membrane protein YraQ (UPF0718 family)
MEFSAQDIITAIVVAFLAGTIVCFLFMEHYIENLNDENHRLTEKLVHADAEFDEAVEVLIQNGLITDARN